MWSSSRYFGARHPVVFPVDNFSSGFLSNGHVSKAAGRCLAGHGGGGDTSCNSCILACGNNVVVTGTNHGACKMAYHGIVSKTTLPLSEMCHLLKHAPDTRRG